MCIISLKWICFLIISVNHIWCKDTKCQIWLWFIRFIIFDNFNFVQLSNSNHFRQYFFTKVFRRTETKNYKVKIKTNSLSPNMLWKNNTYFLQSFRKMSWYFPLKLSHWLFKYFCRRACFGQTWYFKNAEVNPLKTKRVHTNVRKIFLIIAWS